MLEDIVKRGGCSVPWLHTEINLQTDQVKPCCKYTSAIGSANENFLKVWNNESYNALRSSMRQNELPKECSACSVTNAFTYKDFKNSAYRPMFKLETTTPSAFHFTLKNTCNLACRMCHPMSSSKLNDLSNRNTDLKHFFGPVTINNKFDLSKLKGSFAEAQILTISGGEPLIDEDCIALIDMVASESTKFRQINFSTNMTVINQRLINLLNTLPVKVNLNVSIDGPKHIHNYIRHGCDLDQIINNLNHLAKNYKFQFGINSTISALNVGYIPEMLDTINSIGLPFTHLMSSPVLESHLHAGVLPDEIKALYTIKLKSADCKNATQQELVDTALKLLQEDKQEHWPQFVKFTSAFDSATNTNLKSVYPELALL